MQHTESLEFAEQANPGGGRKQNRVIPGLPYSEIKHGEQKTTVMQPKLHPPAIGICRSITKSVSKGLSRIFFHQKITALSQPCHKLTISADTLFRGNIGHVISVPQGMRVRYRTHEWREQYPNLQHCLQSTYELSPCITSLRGNKEYIDLWPGSGSNLIQDSSYWLDTNFFLL